MKILEKIKEIFFGIPNESDIGKRIANAMGEIKENIFGAMRSDEQIIGFLKSGQKVVIEISMKNDRIHYICGTY